MLHDRENLPKAELNTGGGKRTRLSGLGEVRRSESQNYVDDPVPFSTICQSFGHIVLPCKNGSSK